MEYKFDVAFSFAGEDREYVEEVAKHLKQKGIKVFYDMFEEIDLWGKDLGIHFDYVYRKAAKYCVPFLSIHYKSKIWTNYEIKNAISRAIESNQEYILPARFDDTEIDGIRSTIGYVNLKKLSPSEFAQKILLKLGKEINIPIAKKQQDETGKISLSSKILFSEYLGPYAAALGVNITNLLKEHRYFNEPQFILSKPFKGSRADSFYLTKKLRDVNFPVKLEYGESISVDYEININSYDMLWSNLEPDTMIQAIVYTTLGEECKSNLIEASKLSEALKSIKEKKD